MAKVELKPGILTPLHEETEYEYTHRCYTCGNTEGFHTEQFWTDYGYEYDCVCNKCGSDHTDEDGAGRPVCPECGRMDWWCYKCGIGTCSECWETYKSEIEPEEWLCPGCLGEGGEDIMDWQIVADKEIGSIHKGCGGHCNNSDGYWWCDRCKKKIEDEEVVVPNS